MLFSLEEPNKRDLNQAKKNVDFYKDIYKKIAEAIGKPLPEQKTRHAMAKSVTVGNITNKKHKLKFDIVFLHFVSPANNQATKTKKDS